MLSIPAAGKVPHLFRNDGGQFQEVSKAGLVRLPAMNGVKVGDLTGDGIPDLVYADDTGFAYRAGTATGVASSSVRLATVSSTNRGWTVALGDINGDGRTDVYGQVTKASGTTGNPDDLVLVANTGGTFTVYTAPTAAGDANDVEAVRVGGRDQFVVLNGGKDEASSPGPVQLIAWVG